MGLLLIFMISYFLAGGGAAGAGGLTLVGLPGFALFVWISPAGRITRGGIGRGASLDIFYLPILFGELNPLYPRGINGEKLCPQLYLPPVIFKPARIL